MSDLGGFGIPNRFTKVAPHPTAPEMVLSVSSHGPMSKSPSQRFLPILLVLFVGSGCAALMYEIVWSQLLQLVIGASAISLGVLLGTFMGGMCLGSFVMPRFLSTRTHPLKVYGLLELGIGAIGILELIAIPLVGGVYTSFVGHGFAGILLRAAIAAVLLLPPTILMGATLPAISRWVETTREGISWLGFFYGGNIAGAVFGCLLAGFYLLRVTDMAITTYVAVAINAVVGLLGLRLSARTPHKVITDEAPREVETGKANGVYVAIALSGLAALGAEVVWTRQLSLLFGATVYTFSIILAVFLLGLGLGSSAGSVIARSSQRPRFALGASQVLLTVAIAWTCWALAYTLPYWPIDMSATFDPWEGLEIDLIRSIWAVLPAAFLWGASFPLALAAIASRGDDPGRVVGSVYAANTVGAIAGSLLFSAIVIPLAGSHNAERLLIVVSAVAGLIAFAPGIRKRSAIGTYAGVGALTILLISTIPGIPPLVVAYGRQFLSWVKSPPEVVYVGEGRNSSVAVSEWPSGVRNFHVAGKVEASSEHADMRLERMLGHLSALVHPRPKSVLIVGFGAGVTAGTFVVYPDIERIVICEIEPLIPKVVSQYFGKENYNVVNDPRVEIVYDDARHFVLTTKEKFDIITSDPIHPWIKGAATLYTTEYFETAKKHLNPGGVISQWVPLYDSTEDVVRSEFATFFKSFPNGTAWSNDIGGRGYDVVLIGQDGPVTINLDTMASRLSRPDHARVKESLESVGFNPAISVLSTYVGEGQGLQPWLEGAQINTDLDLRLQYLAGLVINFNDPDGIQRSFLRFRRYPAGVFTGSPYLIESLRQALIW
jgi:spermidine synthase